MTMPAMVCMSSAPGHMPGESDPPPFDVNDRNSASEEHRLRYRYLELRTKELQKYISIRHQAALATRTFLAEQNFLEIETPILMKSTPEGARDFLVPSRIHNGKFYALPQSPQTYKQLLMVSGFDRYFQIVKCFRDEDFRADRQPEFTQIDIEMSFVTQEDIISLGTKLMQVLWEKVLSVKLPDEFPIMTYYQAMEDYGSDKPDIRFDNKLIELEDIINDSSFDTFKNIIKDGGRVKCIKINQADKYSRKVIDELTAWLKEQYNVKGLAWMKCLDGETLEGGISKFFDKDLQGKIINHLSVDKNEMLFIVGDKQKVVFSSLGALRIELAKRNQLINEQEWAPLWVVDFPLFEWNDDHERWDSLHHPFTSPNLEDIHLLNEDPSKVRSLGYDIVMNGYELGGGSIRIHDAKLQSRIFDLLGVEKQEAEGRDRPDFTFHLPKGKRVNMDVKFPITHYERFLAAEDEGTRADEKKQFLTAIRGHVKAVDGRAYIDPAGGTVDYVLLFIPNESIYSFINQEDHELMDFALEKRIVLCSPLTLYAILSLIRQSVASFAVEQRAGDLQQLVQKFSEQWVKYNERVESVGKSLATTQKHFDDLNSTRTKALERPMEKIIGLNLEDSATVETEDSR